MVSILYQAWTGLSLGESGAWDTVTNNAELGLNIDCRLLIGWRENM